MKIAQISPLYESVPPRLYGGTERIVHFITEELVALGHEVTLFASGDSATSARLVSPCQHSLRLGNKLTDQFAPHFTMMEMVAKMSHEFDIIHSHIDYMFYPLLSRMTTPALTTLHGRLDLPELQDLYRVYNEIPLVSISDSQRKPLAFANWKKTVYHGLPLNLFHLGQKPEQYLAFLGRICPEKRVDRAIEIAISTGIPIRIAAKIDKADEEYFETNIKHLFTHPLVDFLGEIGENDKQQFLGNALGLLFPIDWPEPFGLAMIEAMACGTPVIAYGCGSVPEVVDEGLTGFVVNSMDEAVQAVAKLPGLSRERCRWVFEKRFSALRMVNDYLEVYEKLLDENGRYSPPLIEETIKI